MKLSKLSLYFCGWKPGTLIEKTDGKDWLCLVWTIHPNESKPSTSSAGMMSENLGSCIYLNSLSIWIWLEFRYINQISLLWFPLSHINLHLIKSMKLERTKKRLHILKSAVNLGLWRCQWKDWSCVFNHNSLVLSVISKNLGKIVTMKNSLKRQLLCIFNILKCYS